MLTSTQEFLIKELGQLPYASYGKSIGIGDKVVQAVAFKLYKKGEIDYSWVRQAEGLRMDRYMTDHEDIYYNIYYYLGTGKVSAIELIKQHKD